MGSASPRIRVGTSQTYRVPGAGLMFGIGLAVLILAPVFLLIWPDAKGAATACLGMICYGALAIAVGFAVRTFRLDWSESGLRAQRPGLLGAKTTMYGWNDIRDVKYRPRSYWRIKFSDGSVFRIGCVSGGPSLIAELAARRVPANTDLLDSLAVEQQRTDDGRRDGAASKEGEKRPGGVGRWAPLAIIVAILVGGYFALQGMLIQNAREDGLENCLARGHSSAQCQCVVDLATSAAAIAEADRQLFMEKNIETCRLP